MSLLRFGYAILLIVVTWSSLHGYFKIYVVLVVYETLLASRIRLSLESLVAILAKFSV